MGVYTNPYDKVRDLIGYKKIWNDAEWEANNGATEESRAAAVQRRNAAAEDAKPIYEWLRQNGYSDVADQLGASGYTASIDVGKNFAANLKQGKTALRPYLYESGKKYNLSKEQIDELLSYDELTGEISFGGKNLGKADSEVDGVSYIKDTSAWDSAMQDYVDRSGVTRTKEDAVNQENENLFKKYSMAFDDLVNADPFATDEAKAILGKYSLAGLQGRDNTVASGGANNGGNIDSFSAANALRQQAALVNQGQMAVLAAHDKKIEHARSLLADMGVNIDRVYNQDETTKTREFNQNETAKNNQVQREVTLGEHAGYLTDGTIKLIHSDLWNSDGSLKNYDRDYSADMVPLIEKYENGTITDDEYETLGLLERARNQKISDQGLAGKDVYPTYKYQSKQKTYTHKNDDANRESAEYMLDAENQANLDATNAKIESDENIARMEMESAKNATKVESKNEETNNSGVEIGKEGLARLDKFVIWINDNSAIRNDYGDLIIRDGKRYKLNDKGGYLASWIYDNLANDPTLTGADKKWMIAELGISADAVETANSKNYQARQHNGN